PATATTRKLAGSAQTAWPVEIPSAVRMPARRPPSSVLRTVTAVSGPGVMMTTADTPRNARKDVIIARSAPLPPHSVACRARRWQPTPFLTWEPLPPCRVDLPDCQRREHDG